MKHIQYKDTKVMRGSKLFELLTSNDPNDKLEAEALHKQISAAHDKHWDPKYNYLKNYVPSY